MPQRSEYEELHAAVPEIEFVQPRGVFRLVVQSNSSYHKHAFGRALAQAAGVASWSPDDLGNSPAVEAAVTLLQLPVPRYVEDDDSGNKGSGTCGICVKRGVLGRCLKCGLLMHYTCIRAEHPGADQECPRCKNDLGIPAEPWK